MAGREWRWRESVLFRRPQLKQSSSPAATPAAQYRAVLNRYCVTCHNEKLKTAGLMLDKVDVANAAAGAEVWEKVIRKLRGNAMPPPGLPRPDKPFYDSISRLIWKQPLIARHLPSSIPAGRECIV